MQIDNLISPPRKKIKTKMFDYLSSTKAILRHNYIPERSLIHLQIYIDDLFLLLRGLSGNLFNLEFSEIQNTYLIKPIKEMENKITYFTEFLQAQSNVSCVLAFANTLMAHEQLKLKNVFKGDAIALEIYNCVEDQRSIYHESLNKMEKETHLIITQNKVAQSGKELVAVLFNHDLMSICNRLLPMTYIFIELKKLLDAFDNLYMCKLHQGKSNNMKFLAEFVDFVYIELNKHINAPRIQKIYEKIYRVTTEPFLKQTFIYTNNGFFYDSINNRRTDCLELPMAFENIKDKVLECGIYTKLLRDPSENLRFEETGLSTENFSKKIEEIREEKSKSLLIKLFNGDVIQKYIEIFGWLVGRNSDNIHTLIDAVYSSKRGEKNKIRKTISQMNIITKSNFKYEYNSYNNNTTNGSLPYCLANNSDLDQITIKIVPIDYILSYLISYDENINLFNNVHTITIKISYIQTFVSRVILSLSKRSNIKTLQVKGRLRSSKPSYISTERKQYVRMFFALFQKISILINKIKLFAIYNSVLKEALNFIEKLKSTKKLIESGCEPPSFIHLVKQNQTSIKKIKTCYNYNENAKEINKIMDGLINQKLPLFEKHLEIFDNNANLKDLKHKKAELFEDYDDTIKNLRTVENMSKYVSECNY